MTPRDVIKQGRTTLMPPTVLLRLFGSPVLLLRPSSGFAPVLTRLSPPGGGALLLFRRLSDMARNCQDTSHRHKPCSRLSGL
jgi:hypothetical protein